MNELSSRQYDSDEVNRIIRRALKLKQEDTINHQDLIETAQEIGIDPKILETAILQEGREFKKKKIRMAQLKRRKVGFYSHLWSYLIVNVLGWGIGVAFHFKAIYFSHGKRFENKIKLKQKRGGFINRFDFES